MKDFIDLIQQYLSNRITTRQFCRRYQALRIREFDMDGVSPDLMETQSSIIKAFRAGKISEAAFSERFRTNAKAIFEESRNRTLRPFTPEYRILVEELSMAIDDLFVNTHPELMISEKEFRAIVEDALDRLPKINAD